MLDRFSTRTWLTRFDSVIVTMIMVAICLKEKGRLPKKHETAIRPMFQDSENLENLLEGYSNKKQLFFIHMKSYVLSCKSATNIFKMISL